MDPKGPPDLRFFLTGKPSADNKRRIAGHAAGAAGAVRAVGGLDEGFHAFRRSLQPSAKALHCAPPQRRVLFRLCGSACFPLEASPCLYLSLYIFSLYLSLSGTLALSACNKELLVKAKPSLHGCLSIRPTKAFSKTGSSATQISEDR